jgi:hypothetical protein
LLPDKTGKWQNIPSGPQNVRSGEIERKSFENIEIMIAKSCLKFFQRDVSIRPSGLSGPP